MESIMAETLANLCPVGFRRHDNPKAKAGMQIRQPRQKSAEDTSALTKQIRQPRQLLQAKTSDGLNRTSHVVITARRLSP